MKELINDSINYEAVCRTAPATPGLSNIALVPETINKQNT